jgi:hypothetical protein
MGGLPEIIWQDWHAHSLYFEKYRGTRVARFSSAVNDRFLRAQGQEHGVRSYGLVVDLAVVYLLDLLDM